MEWFKLSFALILFVLAQGEITGDNDLAFIEDMRKVETSESRVVAGWDAQLGQIPFQIHLRMVNPIGSTSSCGGSVIHHQWILTAAHCVANRFNFVIRVGMVNITRPDWIVEASQKFIHPQYSEALSNVQPHDLGLIKLDHHLPYNSYIQPVRLQNSQQRDTDYTGAVLTVSGYGLTDDTINGGTTSIILQWVHLRGISNAECLLWYPNSQVIQAETLCVEYYNDTAQSSCNGDSGGPLTIVDEDGQLTEVGIVSFGSTAGCNSPFPAGYVRPGYYHDWLRTVTGINFDWSFETNTNEDYLKDYSEDVMTMEAQESSRMQGGSLATIGDNPWLIHLRMTKWATHKLESCVGSLIGHSWALTSASCLNNSRSVFVRYGLVYTPNPELVTEGIVEYLHPDWDVTQGSVENDVALVNLNAYVDYEEHIQGINVAVGDFDVPSTGRFCSWGTIQIYNNQVAGENVYCIDANLEVMEDATIYAYSDQGKATEYDLGAPLVSNGVVIGVLSKYPSAEDTFSAVFVQPRKYQTFITTQTGLVFPETVFPVTDSSPAMATSFLMVFIGFLMALYFNRV